MDEEAIANYCMMYSEFLVPDNYLVMMIIIRVLQILTQVPIPGILHQ